MKLYVFVTETVIKLKCKGRLYAQGVRKEERPRESAWHS